MRYVLAPRSVSVRAGVVSASSAAAAVAPAWLVIVLARELGLVARAPAIGLAVAIGLLGLARGLLLRRRAARRLAALAIEIDGEEMTVRTIGEAVRIPASAIARVSDIGGAYGGLRIELAGAGLPARFDVPKGGDTFADLRAWLLAHAPLTQAPRRRRVPRIALAGAVVLTLFFIPFVVADVRGSRVAIALLLLAAWAAMRAIAARA